ncbi:glycosyltransferase [Sphingomonas abietis]|uniref:Glycosyltransferase n=1 Tax=Sphingomonas abietis TaxID=3012344 RepID=A0ABY7NJ07_9SPHN|nr:glycosyltransferase [Sphingomonas abietis]WBO21504.1 glycosyltransferase [Sphingomonas abietis]
MKRPTSIGIILHDFPLGGTERIALRLAQAWCERGIAVTLFVGADSGPQRALVPPDARLIFADPAIPRSRGSRQRLGRAAARYFTVHPVDAIFVIGNFHWAIVPALAGIASRPVIGVQVSSPLHMPQRGRLRQFVFERRMRRLLQRADLLIAMGETHRRQADAITGRPIAITIPLPALDDDIGPARPAQGRTILAAGRLIHQKGFDLLIAAFRQLDDAAARLVIVGSGPEADNLARQVAASGIAERITLAGYQPDIRPFLDEAALFVMPSRFEGYGAVIVEALGAGRPVIATASTPAVDDVLTDEACGIVVPAEDAAALAEAMRLMLDRPAPDPARLAAAVSAYHLGKGADAYLDAFARNAVTQGGAHR